MTPLQAAKAHCANYQPDGSCLGIYYNDDLSVDWSRWQPRDKCLLAEGKRCAYFEEIILPMRLARPNEAKSLTKAITAYQRQHKLQALQRFCPECREAPLAAKQKVCASCRVKRRQKTYREYNSHRKASNQGLDTTVEPIFTREKKTVLAENGSGQRTPQNQHLNCGTKRSAA